MVRWQTTEIIIFKSEFSSFSQKLVETVQPSTFYEYNHEDEDISVKSCREIARPFSWHNRTSYPLT